DNNAYLSEDGIDWEEQVTDLPVISIFGKMPSYSVDSVLVVVKDEDAYKFAKTMDFSSMHLLNEIPTGYPIENFTTTTVKYMPIHTAKDLIITGGHDINGVPNNKVWKLQDIEGKIAPISKEVNFSVTGSSLFNYDDKIYLLTPEDGKNVLYTSISYGMFWEKANSKQSLPSEFLYRENQSVNIDNKNNIWIFGGVSANQSQLVEVWKGRINKLFLK
ncbi:MAG: hypothetical protein GX921_04635, partial [Bacteroidales bacterium]|nr:hypothetical protein [Bacteroidales bacterium]